MLRVTLWFVVVAVCCSARAAERVIDFNQHPTGKTPPGFRSGLSGGGALGDWRVIVDQAGAKPAEGNPTNTATGPKVLAQLSQDGTDERFPLLILDQESYGDFTLKTRFKMVDGIFEQMAGIAFRMQDTNNYYYVRASALGKGSFRFVPVVNGQRLVPVEVPRHFDKGVWYELQITCEGNRMTFTLDGKEVLPALKDNTFTSGNIAFWTKSDAVSYFGETRITYAPHEILAQLLVRDALKAYPRLVGMRIYAFRNDAAEPVVIASNEVDEIGMPGGRPEQEVIRHDVVYSGKHKGVALVTLPLHDRNGEVAGAVRVIMTSFAGQTDQNILARAQPVVKSMEKRVRTAKDLFR
jgi:hypothetical protein